MLSERCYKAALLALACALSGYAAGPTFIPDSTFQGSALKGWQTLGKAEWKAQNGEISGSARQGGKGGWLMLNQSLQDVGVFARFRCSAGCVTGVLLRAEKTADGMKGVYIALTDPQLRAYRLRLNAQGEEIDRTPLRFAGGQLRIAPPPDPAAGPPRPFVPPATVGNFGLPEGAPLPIQRPPRAMSENGWNQIEILLDANIVRSFLNEGGQLSSATADEDAGRFGPVALYAGGTGEVRFRDLAYRDLGNRSFVAEEVGGRFRMQKLNDFYYAWSAAAADFNRDGVMDVTAGPYYFLGPDYKSGREIYLGQAYNASNQYSNDCWVTHAYDFTGDGWPDILTTSHSGRTGAILYVNPKGEARRWDKYQVVPIVQTEATLLRDIDGDGKPELVYGAEGLVRYAKPDPANPTGPWLVRSVSEKGPVSAHGIGVADVNGDGRQDILNAWGWWEQPSPESKQELWKYHPQAFGRWTRGSPGGGEMAVYDVNGDGLNDVVTSLQAHGFGLAWFEQKRDRDRNITFVEHMIMDDYSTKNSGGVTFSQLHGTAVADVDGDGIQDFVVGKRYWSHLDDYHDPDPYGPAVLYWYRTVRNPNAPGGAEFLPELIHNRSGAGSDVLAKDLNKDGVVDIVTSTRAGTFIFWGNKMDRRTSARRR